ncbi:hypothetical protein LCGC14_0683660 [marine sediment metagenome]|uniref:Uncharacterized protein n=1 Tax=marine sediment metagenome TaxID=412755 RepID=A0A0F9QMK3_9ZZZZ
MSIAILAMACFFTWLCHKRRNILLSMAAAILWLGLSMWFFFGNSPLLPLGTLANDIIAWAFFILMWIPLLFQMDVEIQHEAHGKSYTKYGQEPHEAVTPAYDLYREKLYNRTRGTKRKYK